MQINAMQPFGKMFSIRELLLVVVLIASLIELSESNPPPIYGISTQLNLQSRIAVESGGAAKSDFNGQFQYAERGEFTYLAVLSPYHSYYGCAGAVLSDRWVISTVTCTNSVTVEDMVILVGAVSITEGDAYLCDTIKTHENFNSTTLENNIAVLRTNRPILLTQYVQPISYFRGSFELCKTTFVGYKEVHNSMLSSLNYWTFYTTVNKISNRECQALWTNIGMPELYIATSICVLANIDDSDSYYQNPLCMSRGGEPLVASDSRVLLGLQTRMYDCTNKSPFVFTEVSQFGDWIQASTDVIGVDVL